MTPLYRIGYTLSLVVAKLGFRLRTYGRENLIEDGPAILASNHASFLDPPLVGVCCRKDVYFLARKSLFEKPGIGPILAQLNTVPVDRDRGDVGAIRAMIKLLKSGNRVLVFPEGHERTTGR
jgi:1-acyl-sn-glycerol-3-phosphate acyltransferase